MGECPRVTCVNTSACVCVRACAGVCVRVRVRVCLCVCGVGGGVARGAVGCCGGRGGAGCRIKAAGPGVRAGINACCCWCRRRQRDGGPSTDERLYVYVCACTRTRAARACACVRVRACACEHVSCEHVARLLMRARGAVWGAAGDSGARQGAGAGWGPGGRCETPPLPAPARTMKDQWKGWLERCREGDLQARRRRCRRRRGHERMA